MMKLKQIIWNYLPYRFELWIRELLFPNFRKMRKLHNENLRKSILKIENNKKEKKIKVAFLCNFPSMWNTFHTVFLAMLQDPAIESYLIALPSKDPRENGYTDNSAYHYCRKFYPTTINAFDYKNQNWFDLKKLNPDYVFLSRPYDDEFPRAYKSDVLVTYTKLCYLPYAYCKMNWDCRQVYRCDFLDHVYAVFTQSDRYCKMMKQVYHKAVYAGWKKIIYLGYQRFDLICQSPERKKSCFRKSVLWLPRWTTTKLLEPSSFFRYKDPLIRFFQKHPEYKFICRPHPLMFHHFISTGEMTADDVTGFKRLFSETENFILDENADYLPAFADADIFISDTSSLLVEEFVTGKPIIYCGGVSHFDREAKRWARLMYRGQNQKKLFHRLYRLLDEDDPKRDARKVAVQYIVNSDGRCGERIAEFLKRDYFS